MSATIGIEFASALKECDRLCAIQDAPETPYDSRYKERKILEALGKRLKPFASQGSEYACELLGVIEVRLGVNFLDTQEPSSAQAPLEAGLEKLRHVPKCLTGCIDSLNHLGILWSDREQHKKAKTYLDEAKDLFLTAQRQHFWHQRRHVHLEVSPGSEAAANPVTLKFQVQEDEEQVVVLEKMHTMSLFYLAQVCGNLEEREESAQYCHATLQRQLKQQMEYNPVEWAKNAMQLSGYYCGETKYDLAENCLLAAHHVLEGQPDAPDNETLQEMKANCQIAWSDMYLSLLKYSQALHHASMELDPVDPDTHSTLFFSDLPLRKPSTLVLNPSSINSFEAARSVYKQAAANLTKAKAVYVLDGFVTDHYAILQQESQLYAILAAWEPDLARQLAMHKRRVALLEPMLTQLNPKAYEQICRQTMFDVAGIHSEMVEIKNQQISGEKPAKVEKKLLPMVETLEGMYNQFLKTFEKDGKLPDRIEEENEQAFLTAHFHLARAYGKVPSVEMMRKSLSKYEYITKYAKKHDCQCMKQEVSMCAEMVELLPMKIAELAHSKR